MASVSESIKEYIMSEFLPGEDAGELTSETPLISTGILDSMATLKLVLFLENEFSVSINPQEVSIEHLDTIDKISTLVQSRMG
jgi:acyl carrier protein